MQRVDETRYLWILRAQALFFALSCVLFLVIWLAYDSIDTGVKYQPFLVSGNPKAESVVVSRLSKNISPGSSAEDIAKSLASKYIVERESYGLSREEFLAKAGPGGDIDIFSAPEEYARWAKSPDFAAKLDNRQRRSVVASVPPADMLYMPKSGNLEAKVRLADAQGNTIGERRAILKIKFGQGKEKRPLAGRWRNPLDFRVHEYIIR